MSDSLTDFIARQLGREWTFVGSTQTAATTPQAGIAEGSAAEGSSAEPIQDTVENDEAEDIEGGTQAETPK